MKSIITIIFILFSSVTTAEKAKENFEPYVHEFLQALKENDTTKIKKLSTAKNENYHKYSREILSKVGERPYTMEIKPFNIEDQWFQFANKLSEGACIKTTLPTHILNINWAYTEEKFPKAHRCHTSTFVSPSILIYVKLEGKKITEQACESNPKKVNGFQSKRIRKNQNISESEYSSIKKWVKNLKTFERSKIKTHITKTYKIGMSKRSEIIDKICHELWPVK